MGMKRTIRNGQPLPKKQRIKASSAKAKGRTLQHKICAKISELTGFEWGGAGQDKPIESRGMGQSGTDVRLESVVKKVFPFSVECKAVESWSIPAWIEQAKANQEKGTNWLLFCKKSNEKIVAILEADVLFDLLKDAKKTIDNQ